MGTFNWIIEQLTKNYFYSLKMIWHLIIVLSVSSTDCTSTCDIFLHRVLSLTALFSNIRLLTGTMLTSFQVPSIQCHQNIRLCHCCWWLKAMLCQALRPQAAKSKWFQTQLSTLSCFSFHHSLWKEMVWKPKVF